MTDLHEDLAALLRALKMGDHARPQSPHEVMRECIAAVKLLRAELEAAQAEIMRKDEALGLCRNALNVLDQLGGLGFDKHRWVQEARDAAVAALAPEAPSQPQAEHHTDECAKIRAFAAASVNGPTAAWNAANEVACDCIRRAFATAGEGAEAEQ